MAWLRAATAQGQGWGWEGERAIPESQRCPQATPMGTGTVWALPFPWELLGAAGHLCKVTSEQVSPALAAWRCHQMGNKRVVPGINMHK